MSRFSWNRIPTQILSIGFLIGYLIGLLLLAVSCEFKSYRLTYHGSAEIPGPLKYSAELRARSDGSWGRGAYLSKVDAFFSIKGSEDSIRGQLEYRMHIDSLDFRSSERASGEDQYMHQRLRKYHNRFLLSRTGQMLTMDEEPQLPPVEFSPLNFGRLILYALPSFPDQVIKRGDCWESEQSLLDKFHPEAQLRRRFCLESVHEKNSSRIAKLNFTLAAKLEDGLNSVGSDSASLKGQGKIEFDLDRGQPIFSQMEVEGDFLVSSLEKPLDSLTGQPLALHLLLTLNLRFPEFPQ